MEELKNELLRYIPNLITGIRDMVYFFHEGNNHAGYALLNKIIEGLAWISQAYAGLSTDKSEEITNGLNGMLNQINGALVEKDTVLVADLFEYEVIAILEDILKDCRAKQYN